MFQLGLRRPTDLNHFLFGLIAANRARESVTQALPAMDGYAWLSQAGMFLLLASEFLALVQVLVYGGGVAILLLFALMWLTAATELAPDQWFAKIMADLLPALGSNTILFLVYTAGLMFVLRQYAAVSDQCNATKKEREQLRERLLLHARGAEALVAADGRTPLLTLKTQDRAAHQVAASTSRVLRFTKWWAKANPSTTPTNETEN